MRDGVRSLVVLAMLLFCLGASWAAAAPRGAAVTSATFRLAATATADASQVRLEAEGGDWVAQGREVAFDGWYGHGDARLWMMNADGSGRRGPLRGDVLSPSGR